MTIRTAHYVDASELFQGFEDIYQAFYSSPICWAEDPYLTLGYVEALLERMEEAGITPPKDLIGRIDAMVAANPDTTLYVDFEPF